MQFLPSSSHVNTAIWMHHTDANKNTEKKLHGNYTRMLQAMLNKNWRQHPTKQQLYDHLPSTAKTITIRQTRHVGHCWRCTPVDPFTWMSKGRTTSSNLHTAALWLIWDVSLKTCRKQWTIERGGERGSRISVLMARHDDDDDDDPPYSSGGPEEVANLVTDLSVQQLIKLLHGISSTL